MGLSWRSRAALVAGTLALASTPVGIPAQHCVELDTLPYQVVRGQERLIHLGDRDGWAGREVRLCPRREPARRYRFTIHGSRVLLDCGGTVFDGSATADAPRVRRAVDVDRSTPTAQDVTVRNCVFRGYERGLILGALPVAARPPNGGLSRFRVHHTAVIETRGPAVKVGPHGRDFDLRGLVIHHTERTGIYVEAHVRRVSITSSSFLHNGWSRCTNGREAIAIDAARDIQVVNNVFVDNKYAAVALYKNCGEGGASRAHGANDNTIAMNVFVGHPGPAVRIAPRQALDPRTDDCLADDCSDPPLRGTHRFRDVARRNAVTDNYFIGNGLAVDVGDAPNVVARNSIWPRSPGRSSVRVDVGALELVGRPMGSLDIHDNTLRSSVAPSAQRLWRSVLERSTVPTP